MIITPQDKELFNALAKSQIGKDLVGYLSRLCDSVCDSRTWGEEDTRESALQASKVIKENLINKIITTKEAQASQFGYE